jgi:rod shape-determining protein MreD
MLMAPEIWPRSTLEVLLSLIAAMMLSILPLGRFASLNPDWVALAILFWTLSVPERLGILRAWLIGLVVDELTGRTLGQHAIGYAVMAALALRSRASLRVLRWPVQMLWVLGLLGAAEGLISLTEAELPRPTLWMAAPSLMGALVWPLLARGLGPLNPKGTTP